jgi:DNA-binding NtrC family response regulator
MSIAQVEAATMMPEPSGYLFHCAENAPHIIIADDDANIRRALRACLEDEGYEIDEAQDGRGVIDAVVHGCVDVVLLDLEMPRMGGLETLEELATIYRDRKPRIIILTAWGSVFAAQQADRYGAHAFLEKPVDASALRSIVARVLREKRIVRDPTSAHPEEYLG